MLVESVSGVSYADFVQQRLFEPTGMNNAYVVTEPGALPVGRAVGYIADHASGWRRAEYDSAVPGPGGVYLSLADLEAWYRALADGRILKADSLALAARPPELPGNRRTPYGMGWLAEFAARGPLKDRWYVLAYGSLGGYRAAWQWYREDDLMIAWLANGNDDELLGAFHGVAERLLGTPPVTP
jgi:CubicO group peptidase (beta-lactamase class C family)